MARVCPPEPTTSLTEARRMRLYFLGPWAPAFALAGNAERRQRMRRILAWLPHSGFEVARGLRR
jgi:hypothetical protein